MTRARNRLAVFFNSRITDQKGMEIIQTLMVLVVVVVALVPDLQQMDHNFVNGMTQVNNVFYQNIGGQ